MVVKLRSTRETLCGLLQRQGITNIRQVEERANALEALKGAQADLIIADWNLAGMTGIELLRTVRTDEKLKAIPFPHGDWNKPPEMKSLKPYRPA